MVLGFLADRTFADPRRGHPVAAFGSLASRLEKAWWADSRARGVLYTVTLVGGVACVGAAAQRLAARPWQRVVLSAVVTWAVLGGRSLEKEGEEMAARLDAAAATGDLGPARQRLSHLCSRDAANLDADDLARATVESLAENSADAVTGALFWGALAGVPGLAAYRAANTLDAMVGYRNARYENFGWASARLDDLLNLAPSRLTAVLTVLVGPLGKGDSEVARRALRAWRHDAAKHPSPNAGPVEATAAGALGVQLGGVNTYGDQQENRGTLGEGPTPTTADVRRAVKLTRAVSWAALAACTAIALARA